MRYREASVKGGTSVHRYLIESDNFLTDAEVEGKLVVMAVYDEAQKADDMEDLFDLDVSVEIGDDMDESEFAARVLDENHVRLIDFTVRFSEPNDGIILNIYEVDMRHTIGDKPLHVRYSADCGQSMDVDCIDVISADNPPHASRDAAWRDCLYQLRRYCKVDGCNMICGLFQMQRISGSDYEEMYSERAELVVA